MSLRASVVLYISFAMGWEVPLVDRNTISHGGTWILAARWRCATSGDIGMKRIVGF